MKSNNSIGSKPMKSNNSKGPLSVVEVLSTINDGGTIEEMASKIREITNLVNLRGGTGKVTLTLSVKKLANNQVVITDKLSSTEPPTTPIPNIFFTNEDGHLSRHSLEQFDFSADLADSE